MKVGFLNAELSHVNMERAFVKPPGLSPVEQDRADLLLEKPENILNSNVFQVLQNIFISEIFFERNKIFSELKYSPDPPAITVLIQQHEEHPGHVVAELLLRDPAGDLPELLQVHSDTLPGGKTVSPGFTLLVEVRRDTVL